MTGLAINTTGLVHIYRSQGHDVAALSGIGISVRPGELVGLLGPSGAGKSTLLQLCGGLLTPSAGRLQIGEHHIATMTESELDRMRAGDVGIVLQGAGRNLIPYLTPEDNVRYAQRAAVRGRPFTCAEGSTRSCWPEQPCADSAGAAHARPDPALRGRGRDRHVPRVVAGRRADQPARSPGAGRSTGRDLDDQQGDRDDRAADHP
ncbi:MAG: putative transport system ATP-binding protein [Kribbellaceae bacterium]|nr:putative transport system ATP-binding protein [Kribbellaceae bacterium]